MLKVEFHSLVQSGDVQSGWVVSRRSVIADGIGIGTFRAWGERERNSEALFLDKASAPTLSVPRIWTDENILLPQR